MTVWHRFTLFSFWLGIVLGGIIAVMLAGHPWILLLATVIATTGLFAIILPASKSKKRFPKRRASAMKVRRASR